MYLQFCTASKFMGKTLGKQILLTRPQYQRAVREGYLNSIDTGSRYSTGRQIVSEQNAGIAKSILMIGVPSAALMYGILQFFDPHQRGQHSQEMKQWLQDENKRIGRSHGCEEIHAADIEKWANSNPDHSQKWVDIKKGYEEFRKM